MIRKRDLGRLEFIAEGGAGRVYRIPDFRLPGQPELAYKELHPQLGSPAREQALDAMVKAVAFRASLPPADRIDLDSFTTWSLDLVEEQGAICGVVMPLVPPDFFVSTLPPSGAPTTVLLDMSWLCAKDSQARSVGVDRSAVQEIPTRIALLAQLAYAIGWLHRHNAVYGDLSLKNVAIAVGPPRIKLLDCDTIAALDDPTRVQLHSPFFVPPEMIGAGQKLQDDRTDVYKLGLCIIRGLQQGAGTTQTKDLTPLGRILDTQAVDVIARAVGEDRGGRPTATELCACLRRNLFSTTRTGGPTGVRGSASSRPTGRHVSRLTSDLFAGVYTPEPPAQHAGEELAFLCHSSGDKQRVRDLRDRLAADSVRCWLDEEDLLPGQDWELEIRRAIRASHVVLACLSTASTTNAGYVRRELLYALDRAEEQPEGSIFLIPVRLEPCEVPTRLRHLHRVDLFDPTGYDQLLRAIRYAAPGRSRGS